MTDAEDAGLDPDASLGDRVRRTRELRGMTQKDLADALARLGWDIDATAVTRIEKGTRALRVNQLYLVAEALGARPADLIRDEVAQVEDRLRFIRGRLVSSRRDLVRALNSMGRLQRQLGEPGARELFERAGLPSLVDVGVLKYVEQVMAPVVRAQDRVHLPEGQATAYGDMVQRVAAALVEDIFDVVQPGPEVTDGEHQEEA